MKNKFKILAGIVLITILTEFPVSTTTTSGLSLDEATEFVSMQNEVDIASVIVPNIHKIDDLIWPLLLLEIETSTYPFYAAGQLRSFEVAEVNETWDRQSQVEPFVLLLNSSLNDLKILLQAVNSRQLSRVPFLLVSEENLSPDAIANSLNEIKGIRFDSLIFVYANETSIFEVYRITNGSNVVVSFVTDLTKSLWERRNNLQGHALKVTYAINKPYVYFKAPDNVLTGANIRILELIQKTLNFSLELYEVADKKFGSLDPDTGQWNGVIRELIEGKADLTCADLSMTKERSAVVSFAASHYTSENRLYMQRPQQSLNWLTFIEVFSINYWLGVGITFNLLAIGLVLATRLVLVKNSKKKNYPEVVATVPLALVAYDIHYPVIEGVTKRILIFTVCMWGALNFWSYNAGLVSFLTVEIFTPPIDKLSHLLDLPQYQIMLVASTSHEGYFKDTTREADEIAFTLWNEKIKHNPEAYTKNTVEAETKLMADPYKVYFSQEMSVETTFERYPCEIISSSHTYLRT